MKKKIAVVALIACFIAVGLAKADTAPIPDTIVSPELLGPHYLWTPEPAEENVTDETNIADLVKEGTITPGTEDRIKEVTDKQRTN